MDVCLLCLQLNDDMEGGINVTSTKWLEESIEKKLEKHFWPLKSITPNAWLCSNCWKIVREFHKFYVRIEDAHAYFSSSLLKTELSESSYEEGNEEFLDNEICVAANALEVSQYDLEVPIDESIQNNKERLLIKKETDNEQAFVIEDILAPSTRTDELRDPLQKHPKTSRRICTRTKKRETRGQKQKKTKISTNKKTKNFEQSDIYDACKGVSDLENPTDSEDTLVEGSGQTHTNSELNLNNRLYNDEQNKFVTENFTVKCGTCQCAMQTFLDVCKHSAKEHKLRGFVICCNKKFFRRNILVEHINWHLNPEYFKCKDCGKVLADRRCLEVHTRVHEELERTHMCDICGKGFARPLALYRHKLSHLSNEERNFPCKHCTKKFGNNDLLVEHTRSAHLTKLALICYICGKGMRTTAVYKRHMQQHEGVPLPTYSCDTCGLKMTDIHRLKTHKATKHPEGGKMEYKCQLCPKISPSPKALRAHVRYKHELGYDFKCTICDKAFKRALSLKEHMATHTGIELYTCPYCPRTFKSNANMHGHRKKVHPQKWEEAHREKYSGNLPPNLKIS